MDPNSCAEGVTTLEQWTECLKKIRDAFVPSHPEIKFQLTELTQTGQATLRVENDHCYGHLDLVVCWEEKTLVPRVRFHVKTPHSDGMEEFRQVHRACQNIYHLMRKMTDYTVGVAVKP